MTITESELNTIIFSVVRNTLEQIGVKHKPVRSEWISFNAATKIDPTAMGRIKLEKAICQRLVRTRAKNHDKVNGVRLVNRNDVEHVIKNRLV